MSQPQDYSPISCSFYDELEALATLRKATSLSVEEAGEIRTLEGVIADLWSKDKVEYLTLLSGEVIRLDRLVSVDGKQRSAYC